MFMKMLKEFDKGYFAGICKIYGVYTLAITVGYYFVIPYILFLYLSIYGAIIFFFAVVIAFIIHAIKFRKRTRIEN